MRGAPLDLRLAVVAVGVWLSALAALYMDIVPSVVLAAACAVGAVALEVRGRAVRRSGPGSDGPSRRPGRWFGRGVLPPLLSAVLIGAVCGLGATAARVAVRDSPAVARLVDERAPVTADFVVRDDPRRVRGGPSGAPTYLLPVRFTRVVAGERAYLLDVRAVVLAPDPAWAGLLPGQEVRAEGRLAAARPGSLDAAALYARAGPVRAGAPPWWQSAAGGLRAGLREACAPLPPEVAGLLPGLVVGDVSGLPLGVAEDFRATGMTHLTAVSGSNVAIVVGAVLLVAGRLRLRGWWVLAVALPVLAGFVVLVRPSPSVLRAAVMGGIGLVALAAGRPRQALPVLAVAVVGLVVVDPALAGDLGFALSVLATAGLLVFAGPWSRWLRSRGLPRVFADALVVPAAAQVAVGPVLAGVNGSVSLVAVPVNMLAVPVVAPVTVLGVVATVCAPWWPEAAAGLMWLAGWPARWLVFLAHEGARVPFGAAPWPSGTAGGLLLAVVLVAVPVGIRWRRTRRWAVGVCVVAVAACAGALPVRLSGGGWPPAGAVVVACDVGQGDAAVLPAGGGAAVVVDAGGDARAVDRCLRRLGVEEVPLLVLSHFHVDHVGGLPGVVGSRRVGRILVPGFAEPAGGRSGVLRAASEARVPVGVAVDGSRYVVGRVELEVRSPRRPLRGTRSDANNNSLVLLARVAGLSVLFAGDLEEAGQEALLADGVPVGVDVLKVAHHGSAYQSAAFLDAVSPSVALVSVGAGNDYGHPNAAVLDRLRRSGARVLRTDLDGDLAVLVDGGRAAVATHRESVARGPPRARMSR